MMYQSVGQSVRFGTPQQVERRKLDNQDSTASKEDETENQRHRIKELEQ